MSKHTPGPWEAQWGIMVNGIKKQWHVFRVIEEKAGEVIDSELVCKFDDFEDQEKNKANARLIAAAPDLLEACKAIVEDHEEKEIYKIDPSSCCHVPNHTDLCPYWLAKQAIQKAEEN